MTDFIPAILRLKLAAARIAERDVRQDVKDRIADLEELINNCGITNREENLTDVQKNRI